ncbi:MAG: ATP-binding protein [Chthoniobacterales bacterium]
MKVQTKIILLLVLVVASFLAGLASIRFYEKLNFRRIADSRFAERNRSFDDFLESYSLPLKTLAEDSTCLDQMVRATAQNDRAWLTQYFSDGMLAGFRANAIWVYRQDGQLLFQHDNLHAQPPLALPVPAGTFSEVFAHQPLRHFFVKVPLGLMEIHAGTIHPSADFRRESPAYGYLFVGRLWSQREPGGTMNDSVIGEMSLFTNNEIHLASARQEVREVNDETNGAIVFARSLADWNGAPIARLIITNDSQIIRELQRSSERLLLALIIFAFVLLLLLWFSLNRWVRRPLQLIMDSLRRDDPRPIEQLATEGSEFGALARTVHTFFEQRRKLLREISERRLTEEALHKSEEELRHSQKLEAVGQLAGGVAHDFNNLLTAIIGYAELLQARADNPALVRRGADLIRKAGNQAAELTRQLLAFSRKQLLQPKVIDLNHLVVEMERLLRRLIGERYELVTLPEATGGRVRADPSQLEQVIMNLGVNARDALPEGGRITIRTDNQTLDTRLAHQVSASLGAGDYIVLSVTDNGKGMDAETKSRIFEPFFTTKGAGKGTGLGLATVYGIVRQSGGAIAVESAPGRGSVFTIYLPQERAPLDEIKAAPAAVEPSQDFETILVVEDEEIVRELVCEVLDQHGYHFLCASDGRAGLKMAAEHPGKIDLLLTDVIMPLMNGHELAAQLAEKRPDLKVLYVSGYSDNDIGHHGVLDGNVELLEKPFSPQALARKVREILGGPVDTAAAPLAHV